MKLGPKNVFDVFKAISMRKKTFFFLLFLSFYMVGLQEKKKIENRFFQIAPFLGGVPLNTKNNDEKYSKFGTIKSF
jgi:hypothetical protein